MATAAATLAGISVQEAAPLPVSEEQSLTALALSAWQRGSCPELQFSEDWLSAEECVLMPH